MDARKDSRVRAPKRIDTRFLMGCAWVKDQGYRDLLQTSQKIKNNLALHMIMWVLSGHLPGSTLVLLLLSQRK